MIILIQGEIELARERIIVKLALSKVEEALKTIIKVSLYAEDNQISDMVDVNLLSLSLKFLQGTNKLPKLLREIQKILSDSQKENPEKIPELAEHLKGGEGKKGFWMVESKFDDPYLQYIYPTTRGLEALAPLNPSKEIIAKGINFLFSWMEKENIKEMTADKIKYAVPIMQAAVRTARNSRGEVKKKAEQIIDEAYDFATTKNLNDNTYAQTVRYLAPIYNNHVLSNEEVKPLLKGINSGVFRKMVKGLELLPALNFELPPNATNSILDMLPKFRKHIFNTLEEGSGAVYFASISESMKNTLKYYHSKTFARSFFNLMVEESTWISQPIFRPLHIAQSIVGTSLLIFARGALRR